MIRANLAQKILHLAKINRQTLKSPTKILYPIYYSRINQNSPYVRQ